MSRKSLDLMQRLSNVTWFRLVGQNLGDDGIIQVGSWKEAMNCLNFYAENELFILPTNQIRYLLRERAEAQYQNWNEIANDIRPIIRQLVAQKTEGVPLESTKMKLLRDHLSWDIMHASMETEYEEICTIDYYRKRLFFLLEGHCPCGLEGVYPQGKHVIY